MTGPEGHDEPPNRWQPLRRRVDDADGAPPAADVLREELDRIEHRVHDVIAHGRSSFVEGSESYDRATVAILRLAALFEQEKRFGPFLTEVTEEERRGITTTRNIAAHSGYGALNADVFWRTVTERCPDVVARIRSGLGR